MRPGLARVCLHPQGSGQRRRRNIYPRLVQPRSRRQSRACGAKPAAGPGHLHAQGLHDRTRRTRRGAADISRPTRGPCNMPDGGHSRHRWIKLRVPGWLLRLRRFLRAVRPWHLQGRRRRRCGVQFVPGWGDYAWEWLYHQRRLRGTGEHGCGRGHLELCVQGGLLWVRPDRVLAVRAERLQGWRRGRHWLHALP